MRKSPHKSPLPAASKRREPPQANQQLPGQRRAQLASHYRARFRAGGGR